MKGLPFESHAENIGRCIGSMLYTVSAVRLCPSLLNALQRPKRKESPKDRGCVWTYSCLTASCSRNGQNIAKQLAAVDQSLSDVCLWPCRWQWAGLPVLHDLLGLAQTHVHRAGEAIQPSCPLPSPSPLYSSKKSTVFQQKLSLKRRSVLEVGGPFRSYFTSTG